MRRLSESFAVAVVAALALTACSSETSSQTADDAEPSEEAATAEAWSFVTEPDLTPPVIEVSVAEDDATLLDDSTYAFLGIKDLDAGATMKGAVLVDGDGDPVWVQPADEDSTIWDVRVQEYQGEPVITYWEGEAELGVGLGELVVLDDTYTEILRLSTTGDLETGLADMHVTSFTDVGTVFVEAYVPTQTDLTAVGGAADGWVFQAVVQEIDLATGEVVFEWRSLDDVPVTEAVYGLSDDRGTQDAPYDYFHINSVEYDDDGNLLVSARNTSTVYKIDHDTATVTWRLGGTSSDFEVADDAVFAYQHDATRAADGTLLLFDNANGTDHTSRGLRLDVDEEEMTATLVTEYVTSDGRQADTQGDVQELENGDIVVGWGEYPAYSEFSADGTLLYDATFVSGTSYRAYAFEWTATPTDPPVAVQDGDTVHASWNGATEVVTWQVVSGADAGSADVVASADRSGFETAVDVADAELGAYVGVQALDADGEVIGSAEVTAA
ncbi:MAG TPA: arylsulfotransferase family protein [Cellulomonas sp.]